jgi:hypothetical protein
MSAPESSGGYLKFQVSLTPAQLKVFQLSMRNGTGISDIVLPKAQVAEVVSGSDADPNNNFWLLLTRRQVTYVDNAYNNETGCRLAFSKAQIEAMKKYNPFDQTPKRGLLDRVQKKPAKAKPDGDVVPRPSGERPPPEDAEDDAEDESGAEAVPEEIEEAPPATPAKTAKPPAKKTTRQVGRGIKKI